MLHILYVEDDADILRFATIALTKKGFKVTAAKNGVEGWNALHSQKFDLLITDNDMPRMTGLQLIEKIRAAGLDIPIIVASGSAFALESPNYRWLDLTACIQKPFTFEELLYAVNHASEARTHTYPNAVSPELARRLLETVPHQDWGLAE